MHHYCCIWFCLVLTELFLRSVVYSSRIKALAQFVHLFTIQYKHVHTIYALIVILLSSLSLPRIHPISLSLLQLHHWASITIGSALHVVAPY